ncbi:His-Xaa-Ser system protein HxsD [Candidatus Aerophobetes bacterium]|uniref:His-Xaa-Ser system protein HxsD n=1 Tax=Aerophobetes bacterium TaxID=2030807 RepID=A0A497E3G3_UNCAE|nr:MAG: His-Xaa-Ser system protein HxsD [Candidatus Aerophobetes bacterium]
MSKKNNFKSKVSKNQIIIKVNPKIYPLEAIYGAAYVFLDRAYLFLDGNPEKEVIVALKGKEKMTERKLKNLAGEFYNELLNCALRQKISQNNQKIREYIVSQALLSAIEEEEEEEWQKDPLGIAVPWEEKYGKKK